MLKVFLCHSSNDKFKIRILYHRLLEVNGVQPWLDEYDLVPGQNWDQEIRAAVRRCDVVLVCMSRNSTTKEGYVHKELRQALDFADEKPEGTIFIIPVRLEECEVPLRLQHLQRLDWFDLSGFQRLLLALEVRARQLGIKMAAVQGRLLYDSALEPEPFKSWTLYNSRGIHNNPYFNPTTSEYNLAATGTESVGIDKSVNFIYGRAEFTYLISKSNGHNVCFCAIPMQETGIARTGLIELGSNVQDDPRNERSVNRIRFFPETNIIDASWRRDSMIFDFRQLPNAFYVMFSPRINEGCDTKGPGLLKIKSVQLYAL
jgi:hypothetical protein